MKWSEREYFILQIILRKDEVVKNPQTVRALYEESLGKTIVDVQRILASGAIK